MGRQGQRDPPGVVASVRRRELHEQHGYEIEAPALFRRMLADAKAVVDPAGRLNPGVLYDAARLTHQDAR